MTQHITMASVLVLLMTRIKNTIIVCPLAA